MLDKHPDPGWEHTKVKAEGHGMVVVGLWATPHS